MLCNEIHAILAMQLINKSNGMNGMNITASEIHS